MLKILNKEDIFAQGEKGINTYRIPTMVCTKNNVVVICTEARINDQGDSGEINIITKRSIDGGKTFSDIQTLAGNKKDTYGNPALIYDASINRIVLLFCFNYGDLGEQVIRTKGAKRDVYTMYSDDEGVSWSKTKNITNSVKREDWRWYATGPNHGVQMESGRLIMTCNHSQKDINNIEGSKATSSHIIYSDDHGNTWQLGTSSVEGTNECCGVKLPDNKLMVNMRTYDRGNYRTVFISEDEGKFINNFYEDKSLICPVCQASIIDYKDKLLFSNPKSTERKNMTLQLSNDFGKTWTEKLQLNKEWAAYSDLAINKNDEILCLFENGHEGPYEKITLATIKYSD